MPSGLTGRVALVTGAGGGLGRAVAERLVAEGCSVAAVDVDSAGAEETVMSLNQAIAIQADVSNEVDVARAFGVAATSLGPIELLHANAGVLGRRAAIAELGVDELDRLLAVNVRGVFLTLRELVRRAEGDRPPVAVATASTAAHRAYSGYGAYAASKHAVLGLVRGAARDYGPSGIRVNAVSPGGMATEMAREVARATSGVEPGDFSTAPGMEEQVAEIPLGRLGDPADVASAAVWLLSDEARHVNGASFVVDGGVLA